MKIQQKENNKPEKLDIETFKESLGTWYEFLKPFFETEEAFNIYSYLKNRARKGNKVLPESTRTFNAFKNCSKADLKCIMIGLSPYHTYGVNRMPLADGMAFSASLSEEEKINSSLKIFYEALENDLGIEVEKTNDLSYLADQGVLLLNYSLTCEKGKATIHSDANLWGPFHKFLFEEVLGSQCGTPIVLFGKEASKLKKHMFPMCHLIKEVEHPAYAAKQQRMLKHDNLFSWVNRNLKDTNGEEYQIEWDRNKFRETREFPF